MRDDVFMRRALALASKAAGNTSPNPMVGAVIVADDETIVGEGYHERAGAPHAEAVALERAGMRAAGATLYLTLEPCTHQGRTPPCTDAIVRSGIVRVVIAAEDPDDRVRGAGIRALREASIRVEVGMLEPQARYLNRMYRHLRRTGRSFVTLKMAQSLDAAIGVRSGERLQLTGAKALAYVRALRFEHDAVMVGVGTAIIDDPQLTVRPYKQRAVPYVRIVVDSNARLPLVSTLVKDQKRAATVVAVTAAAPDDRVEALRGAGVEILMCATVDGRVDVIDLLTQLGRQGKLGVLCEGGPALAGSLLDADAVDELHCLIAPVVLGTAAVAPAFAGMEQPCELLVDRIARLGDDTLVVGRPKGKMP